MSKIQKLQNLVVVQVNVNIWSGQTKLRPEDFRLGVGGSLPPEKVALLGTKKLVDTYNLRPFGRVKQRITRKLSGIGIEFLNGFAVPADKVAEAELLLEQSQEEFQLEKQKFVQNYMDLVDAWAKENPDLEKSIRESALSQAEVESKLNFNYTMFQIEPLASEAQRSKMNASVDNLGNNLLEEVAKQADEFYKTNFLGRDQVGIRTQDTLRNIRNRLDGLSFLDSRISPLVGLLDQALGVYKQAAGSRCIGQPYFLQILGAVLILTDLNRMEEFINGQVTVDSAASTAVGNQAFDPADSEPQLNVAFPVSNDAPAEAVATSALPASNHDTSGEAQDVSDVDLEALDPNELASIEAFFGQSTLANDAQESENHTEYVPPASESQPCEVHTVSQRDEDSSSIVHDAPEPVSDENLFF